MDRSCRQANPGAFQISRAFDFNIWFQANNFIQFAPYVPGLFIKRIQWKSIDCHPHKRFAEIAIFSEWMRDENCLNEHALHPTFMRTCRCRGSAGARLPSGVLPGPSERAVTEYNVLQALSFVVTHCNNVEGRFTLAGRYSAAVEATTELAGDGEHLRRVDVSGVQPRTRRSDAG